MQYEYIVTDPTNLLNKDQQATYNAERESKTDEELCDYLTKCLKSLDDDALVAIIPTSNDSHNNQMTGTDPSVRIEGVRFTIDTGMVAVVQLTQKNQLTMFAEFSIDLILNREMGQIVIFDSDETPYVESDNAEDGSATIDIKTETQSYAKAQQPKFSN